MATAGLQQGDRIVAVDRQPVATIAELKYQLKPHLAGDEVEILIERDGVQVGKTCVLANSGSIAWIKPEAAKQKPPAAGPLPPPRKKKRDPLDRL